MVRTYAVTCVSPRVRDKRAGILRDALDTVAQNVPREPCDELFMS